MAGFGKIQCGEGYIKTNIRVNNRDRHTVPKPHQSEASVLFAAKAKIRNLL